VVLITLQKYWGHLKHHEPAAGQFFTVIPVTKYILILNIVYIKTVFFHLCQTFLQLSRAIVTNVRLHHFFELFKQVEYIYNFWIIIKFFFMPRLKFLLQKLVVIALQSRPGLFGNYSVEYYTFIVYNSSPDLNTIFQKRQSYLYVLLQGKTSQEHYYNLPLHSKALVWLFLDKNKGSHNTVIMISIVTS